MQGKHSPLQDALAGPEVPLGSWVTGNTGLWFPAEKTELLQKCQPCSLQVCLLQTVQKQAQLTLQDKREMVENWCVLLFVAPTALLVILSKAVFNTNFKTKI